MLLSLPFLTTFGWTLFYLHMNGFSITILGNTNLENEAHKILHTFEKMDAINPTFEREEYRIKLMERKRDFNNLNYFFGF